MSNLILYALLKCKCILYEYTSKNEFPTKGNSFNLYVDISSKSIYIWNETQNQYIKVSNGDLSDYYSKDEIQVLFDQITIEKLDFAENGFSSSYQLTIDGKSIGDKINIPKDIVVQSGSVKTVESKNSPIDGYMVGDKYIDLLIANSNDEHIYILVSDLVEGVGEYYSVDNVKKGEIFNDYDHNVASGEYSHAEGHGAVASGDCSHAEGNYNYATGGNSHAEGASNNATNACSHAEGYRTTANGEFSHTQGFSTTAEGNSSHAEGGGTKATGDYSHAEGGGTKTIGDYSHAEGGGTKTIGICSHAEGISTTANGENSHAEGAYTTAQGQHAHAEGCNSNANGACSHAGGMGTVASGNNQVAIGMYNVEDRESVLIIGNGSDVGTRSNALAVDWQGNIVIKNDKNLTDIINALATRLSKLDGGESSVI